MALIAVSCTKASFSGAGQGSRPRDAGPVATESVLSCRVEPAEIKVGEKASISVAANTLTGELRQTVLHEETKVDRLLSLANGSFAPKDGSPNEINAEAPGRYSVEVRSQTDGPVLASCELNVTPKVEPPSGSPTAPENPAGSSPGIPQCRPDQTKIGTQIAFLIDNSNSNAATDCPGSKKVGVFGGADTYECTQETSREKAVLAVFDLLRDFSAGQSADAMSVSRVAVTSFPTRTNYTAGYNIESPFLAVTAESRSQMQSVLNFTRRPYGMTPYLGALTSADQVMNDAVNDKRSKVVVLVTDGEPTDQSPKSAATKAEKLRAAGMKVITVFYSGTAARAQRESAHLAMLQRMDLAFSLRPERHWYDQSEFATLDSYTTYLLGNASSPSLLARITSKQDPSCQDVEGKLCARTSYEVGNAQDLSKTFLEIVTSQAIGCSS